MGEYLPKLSFTYSTEEREEVQQFSDASSDITKSTFSNKGKSNTVVTYPHSQPLEEEFNRPKAGKRKNRYIDDPFVRDSQLSTHDDRTVEDSQVSEEPTTKVEEHSPTE